MRRLFALLALVTCACGVRLDEPSASSSGAPAPPVSPACRWFEQAGVTRVSGRVSALSLEDGSTLFVAGSVDLGGAERDNAGFVAAPGASADDCFADAVLLDHAVLDASTLPSGDSLTALAPFEANGKRWLYYDLIEPAPGEPFGVKRAGTGIAAWDGASERFVPSSQLLVSGDRASYGSAALVVGDTVYAYGCVNGFSDADCSVASVPADRPDDESAYRFYSGGGHFSESVEDAWSMVRAGDPVGVALDAASGRTVMLYASPLASTLTLRSGLSPTGPWSKPFEVASCELPAKDAFCGSVTLLPSPATGTPLAVGYAIGTFTAGAADAAPETYWSRLTHVAVPSDAP